MFVRHDLLWLTAAGWDDVLAQSLPQERAALERWQAADWPVVVRRSEDEIDYGQVCIGIPLPPDPADGSKMRIGSCVPVEAVRDARKPLALEDALPAAPAPWQPGLQALLDQAREQQLSFRVYGSLAMQALTGQAYITAASDIDVLFLPASVTELGRGTGLLSYFSGQLPLDGEIVFPGPRAVAWKEWTRAVHARGNARVLAKSTREINLTSVETLLSSFDKCAPVSPS